MEKKIILLDQENEILLEVQFDEDTEYLQVWGSKNGAEKILIVEEPKLGESKELYAGILITKLFPKE
jgi:hypothetical protein